VEFCFVKGASIAILLLERGLVGGLVGRWVSERSEAFVPRDMILIQLIFQGPPKVIRFYD
jgi:hypothetical protein